MTSANSAKSSAAGGRAEELVAEMDRALQPVYISGAHRPKVYFEEWPEPLITGIGWISELIERAGGADIFPETRREKKAAARTVSPEEVIARAPEIIFASWCGKPVEIGRDHVAPRLGPDPCGSRRTLD